MMKLILLTDEKKAIAEKLEELFRQEKYEVMLSEWNGFSISIIKSKKEDFFEENLLLKMVLSQIHQESTMIMGSVLEFDGICMNLSTHEVTIHHESIKLTKTEYSILKIFLQNPLQVLEKKRLLDKDCNLGCVESSLKVHISNLRRKLKKITGKDYIESIRGVGFMLVYPKEDVLESLRRFCEKNEI